MEKLAGSETIALDAINARPLIPEYFFSIKRECRQERADSFRARVRSGKVSLPLASALTATPVVIMQFKEACVFQLRQIVSFLARGNYPSLPPLSSGQSTERTRVESLHKLKFLRSHRGAEKSGKWNAIRRRDSGTSPGKNETRRNQDEEMNDDDVGLRFASFSFSIIISIAYYSLIYSFKKRRK